MKVFALALALTSSLASAANWQLDNSGSSLHFVSVKNDVVAETHQFNQLTGQWDGNSVSIQIPVSSLETQIPIRNERIWQYVLQAETFAAISVSATLAEADTAKLATGQSMVVTLPLKVTIAAETTEVIAAVRITKLSDNSLAAASVAPIMLNTNSFKLTAGVAKLQQLAGLKRIDPLLPVSFNVQFTKA
ncbi:YceI family protein [Rheinheimera muenzenbergensis]|uniref:YceI family protein n=1 Tax=Rheinheimera muenzenbergensis TaxID=1193628 RepID=A0ABU8CBN0_9GAMM